MLALWRSTALDTSATAMVQALKKLPATQDIIDDIEALFSNKFVLWLADDA